MLISLLTALVIGCLSGIGSSAPLGPTNFWIAFRVLNDPLKRIKAFVWGVIVADILYAHIAFWGYFFYLKEAGISVWMGIGGSVAIIILGIMSYLSAGKDDPQKEINVENASWFKELGVGFFISASNPTFVLFWLFVASILGEAGLDMNWTVALTVYLGIVLGDWGWYFFFAKLVDKGKERLNDVWMVRITRGIAISLVLFGLYGIYIFLFTDPLKDIS